MSSTPASPHGCCSNRAAAYDSFYLALAEGLDCELWTADERLHNAAGVAWVKLLEEANR